MWTVDGVGWTVIGDGSKFVWGVEDCEVKGIIVENIMGVKKLISRERKIVWVI